MGAGQLLKLNRKQCEPVRQSSRGSKNCKLKRNGVKRERERGVEREREESALKCFNLN